MLEMSPQGGGAKIKKKGNSDLFPLSFVYDPYVQVKELGYIP